MHLRNLVIALLLSKDIKLPVASAVRSCTAMSTHAIQVSCVSLHLGLRMHNRNRNVSLTREFVSSWVLSL